MAGLRFSAARLTPSRRLLVIARWGIGLALVALLLTRFDAAAVLRTLRGADLRIAIPAILGLVAMHLLGAATWRWLVARLAGHSLGWRSAIRTYYIAQAVGGLTPANLGADAYRLVVAPDSGMAWRDGLLPIVVQRIGSSLGLGVLAVTSLVLLPQASDLAPIVVATAVVLVAGSVVLLVFTRRSRSSAPGGTDRPRGELFGAYAVAFALGLAFHAGSIGLSYLLVVAVTGGQAVPVLACLAISRLSILVPISPSGLGIQEGALTLLFVRIGLPAEVALAAALLNRLAMLLVGMLGTALLAGGRSDHRSRNVALGSTPPGRARAA